MIPYFMNINFFSGGFGQPTVLFYMVAIFSFVVAVAVGVLESLVLFSGSENFEK